MKNKTLILVLCLAGFFTQAIAQSRLSIRAEAGPVYTQLCTRKMPPSLINGHWDNVASTRGIGGCEAHVSLMFDDSTVFSTLPRLKNLRSGFALRAGYSNLYARGSFSGIRYENGFNKHYTASPFTINENYLSLGFSLRLVFGAKRFLSLETGLDAMYNTYGKSLLRYSREVYQLVTYSSGVTPTYTAEQYYSTETGRKKIETKKMTAQYFANAKVKIFSREKITAGVSAQASWVCGRISNDYGMGCRSAMAGLWVNFGF